MREKMTVLGVALVAALAIGAIASSVAVAEEELTAAEYPVTLQGKELKAEEEHLFGLAGSEFHCEEASMEGEAGESSTTATLAPSYGGCAWSSYEATIAMNGCTWRLHLGEVIESEPARHHATADLVCPEGKEMTVTTASGECQISIPAQNGKSTVEIKEEASETDLAITFNLTAISYTVENSGYPCPLIGGSFQDGTYAGAMTVSGESGEEAVAVDVGVPAPPHPSPGNAQFTAEEFPLTLEGSQQEQLLLELSGRSFTCEVANFHAELTEAEPILTVVPAYEECHAVILGTKFPVTITFPAACRYALRAEAEEVESGHRFTSGAYLACAEGKEASVQVFKSGTTPEQHDEEHQICAYAFPSQGGLNTIVWTNEPEGEATPADWIKADLALGEITSNRTFGPTIVCGVEHSSSGSVTGTIQFKGTNEAEEPIGITLSTIE